MHHRTLPGLAALMLTIGPHLAASAATTIRLTPDEGSSADVFVYEFAVPGAFGIPTAARVTNLDSATLNALDPPAAVPFGDFLGSSNTVPLIGAMGETRAHDTRTLIRFDLGLLALQPDQVGHATINLYALPGLPPFADPTDDSPVTTELHRVTQAWDEQAVTWETQPSVSAAADTSALQTGVNQWVSFDVTGLVRDWLAHPDANYGIELSQADIVTAASGMEVASLYASSAFADASLRPNLSISAVSAVPLPPALGLMCGALVGMAGYVRRAGRNGDGFI